jgi:hypothetical protein
MRWGVEAWPGAGEAGTQTHRLHALGMKDLNKNGRQRFSIQRKQL